MVLCLGIILLVGCSQGHKPDPELVDETVFAKNVIAPYETDEIKVSDIFADKKEDGLHLYLKLENTMGDSIGLNTMDSTIAILTTDIGSYQALFPRKILKPDEALTTTIKFPRAEGTLLSLEIKGLYRTNNSGIAIQGSNPISAAIALLPSQMSVEVNHGSEYKAKN